MSIVYECTGLTVKKIIEAHNNVRKNATNFFATNLYLGNEVLENLLKENRLEWYFSDLAFILIEKREGYSRLFYSYAEEKSFNECIQEIIKKRNILSVDIIAKNRKDIQIQLKYFLNNNFNIERMSKRMTRINERVCEVDDSVIHYAEEDDAERIYEMLNGYFEPTTSHIPFLKEIKEAILDKEIIVDREGGKVIAMIWLAQKDKIGDCRYWLLDQAFKDNDRLPGFLVYQQALLLMKTLKKVTLFVGMDNEMVIKMHRINGFKFDGIEDWVLVNRP